MTTNFVGKYTREIRELLTASLISGESVMMISKPGSGKTEMSLTAAYKSAGSEKTVFIPIDPSTPPEVVNGTYDPSKLLNGELVRVLTGTPYDPNARVVILDEVWRGNDVIFDALLHATSQKTRPGNTAPVFWGTANFIGKSERTEALKDRFAFWKFIVPDFLPREIARAHLNNGFGISPEAGTNSEWAKDIPDLKTIDEVARIDLTPRAENAVLDFIELLANEAISQSFEVNGRRIAQWVKIIKRNSAYKAGGGDFDKIPESVQSILRFAYPVTDVTASGQWNAIVSSIADQLGAVIEAARAEAYTLFKEVSGLTSAEERMSQAVRMGTTLNNATQTIRKLAGDDPRGNEAIVELTDWFGKAMRGERI